MAIIVIGGHTRNIGKTSAVCGLIAAIPQRCWTAIKITQCKHAAVDSEPCDCELAGQTMAISEERDAAGGTDSSRYLAAGAVRSLWVRTLPGRLGEAMARIRVEMDASVNVILESNSVLEFLKPDLYVAVLDPAFEDFKPSARLFLDRADAVLIRAGSEQPLAWPDETAELIEGLHAFRIESPDHGSPEFAAFVARRLWW